MDPSNDSKFRELILYVSLRSEGDECFGATKLNLLLFLIDVEALRLCGQAITGQEYEKQPYGPAPRGLQTAIGTLRDAGDIVVRGRIVGPYAQHRSFALRAADLGPFTATEIALVDVILQRYRSMMPSHIRAISHELLGWKFAEPGEKIPIATGLISDRELTQEEYAYAKTLTNVPRFVQADG